MMKRILGLLLLPIHLCATELSGSLVDAPPRSQPIQGHPVRLRIFRGQSEVAGSEVLTDRRGDFVFKKLQTSQDYSYVVSIDYFGVPYFKGPFQFQPAPQPLRLGKILIHPSTKKLENISMSQSVFVEIGRSDMMKIHHTLTLFNPTGEAYTPLLEDSERIHIPLAKGGFKLEFTDFLSNLFEIDEKKSVLVFKAPIYPTSENNPYQIKFSYLLPYSSKRLDLDFSSEVQKRVFNLFINRPGLGVEAPALQKSADVPYRGEVSQVFSGGPLPGATPILVSFKGLPLIRDRYLVGLALGVLLVALVSIYFLRLPSARRDETRGAIEADLLRTLAELEAKFRQKNITESDYAYENARLREIFFELRRHSVDGPSA